MKLITEITESVKVLTEENADGKKSLFIEGIFLQGNIPNRNGRRYNTDVLEKEVGRYVNENVSKGRAYGELGHPDGPSINLDRVSHIITDLSVKVTTLSVKPKFLLRRWVKSSKVFFPTVHNLVYLLGEWVL